MNDYFKPEELYGFVRFRECLPHVRAREGKVARERGCGALLRVDNRLAT